MRTPFVRPTTSTTILPTVIWLTRALSDFISALNMIVITAFIFLSQQSAYELSLFFAAAIIGGSFASLLGKHLSKQVSMNTSMIGLNLIRGLILLILILLPSHLLIFFLPAVGFLGGLSNALFIILFNSHFAHWIAPNRITRMNAAITAGSAIAAILAGMSSGVLVELFSYRGVMILNALLYCLVATLFYLIHHLHTQQQIVYAIEPTSSQTSSPAVSHLHLSKRVMIGVLIMVFLISFANAFHQLGFPDLAKLLAPDNLSQGLGYLMSAWGMGRFLGAFALTRTLKIQSNVALLVVFFMSVLVMSNGFIFTFQQSTLSSALVFILIAGMGESGVEVSQISFIHKQAQRIHTLLFSALSFSKMIAGALGAIIAGQCYRFYAFPLVILILQIWIILSLIVTFLFVYYLSKKSLFATQNKNF